MEKDSRAPWIKCNIDVCVFSSHLGHGCVIRDIQGEVIAARSTILPGGGDVFMAETMSCKEALSWLKELNFDRVVLEMDA